MRLKRRIRDCCLTVESLEQRRLLVGDPIITEFMADNGSTLADGDGEYFDWIEIYNRGDTVVDLAGYRLSDKPDSLAKWVFPSVWLEPAEYLIVFASGRDLPSYVDSGGHLHTNFALRAAGEYLALVSPHGTVVSEFGSATAEYPAQREDISFGLAQKQTLLDGGSSSMYAVPLDDSLGRQWTMPDFDALAHGFSTGSASIGVENRPHDRVNFVGHFQTSLPNRTHAVYLRAEFHVDHVPDVGQLTLGMKYDNGFAAYINGKRVAQQDAPESLDWFATSDNASRRDAEALEFVRFDLTSHVDSLVDGRNVLAIHGLNSWEDDHDMLIVPELVAVVSPRAGATKTGYMTSPTPRGPNVKESEVFAGFVSQTQFSAVRGFYEAPIEVTMTTQTAGAAIRYTTDGSPPTATTGEIYSEPISVNQTTILRAAALKPGHIPSVVTTHTYLYLDDVLEQDGTAPAGYPQTWGAGLTDWGIDQNPDDLKRIAGNPGFSLEQAHEAIKDSLGSLPTLSLVLDKDDMFGRPLGIYTHTQGLGERWERPASVELIHPDGDDGFQVDAGIRIQGFTSRDPNRNPKHSLRLVFRRQYGDAKLRYPFFGDGATDQFDTIVLRSNSQDAWVYDSAGNRQGQFIRDQWARETQLEMGQPAPHGNWVHLYINGLYWGLYNPTERPDASFNASYFGGDKEDYDSLKNHEEVIDGNGDAYQDLLSLIQRNPRRFSLGYRDLSSDEAYQRVLGNNADGTPNPDLPKYIDAENLIDYVIHNMYADAVDWPGNNYIGRNRNPDSDGFRFFDWDNEHGMKGSVRSNRTLPHSRDADSPTKFHHALRVNAEYQMLFADRLHRAFFNGGPLYVDPENPQWDPMHPERNVPAARWMRLTSEIEQALIAEAARWGDARGIQYTPHDQFQTIRSNLLANWFPRRSRIVLDQFRQQGLYPDVEAPSFSRHGGVIPAGTKVQISAPTGTVYYTIDNTDPRQLGGGIAAGAMPYNGPVGLYESATLKSRILHDGRWSALNQAEFWVQSDVPLRVAEVNFNPHTANAAPGLQEEEVDNDRFEFIELMNTSSQAINLNRVTLSRELLNHSDPIPLFRFADQTLPAGERIVIVRDRVAFQSRYGPLVRIANGDDGRGGPEGQYHGQLSNDGDTLTLTDAHGGIIQRFRFSSGGSWPPRADGIGSSLEVINLEGNYDDPFNWRASTRFGGTPGTSDSANVHPIVFNEVLAHSEPLNSDMVELFNQVRESGKYLSAEIASFTEGDWNGDGLFDQLDVVFALQLSGWRPRL